MKSPKRNANFKSVLKEIHLILKNACKLSVKVRKKTEAIQVLLTIKNEIRLIDALLDQHGFHHPKISLSRMSDVKSCVENQTQNETTNGAWCHLLLQPDTSNLPPENAVVVKTEQDQFIEEKPAISHLNTNASRLTKPSCVTDPTPILTVAKFETQPCSPGSEVPSLTEVNYPSPDDNGLDDSDCVESPDKEGISFPDGPIVDGYCRICQLFTGELTEELKVDHMVRIHPGRVFECECGARFDESEKTIHESKHPGDNLAITKLVPETCYCGLRFLTNDGLMTRELKYFWTKKGDTNFVKSHVDKCSKFVHGNYGKYLSRCQSCPKKPPRHLLFRHYVENHISQMEQCAQCSEWHTKQTISSHRSKVHNVPARKKMEAERLAEMKCEYACEFCNEQVSVPHVDSLEDARKVHMKDLHSNEILRCECGIDIYSGKERDEHELDHADGKIVKLVDLIAKSVCVTCGYEFLNSQKLMSSELKYFWFEKKDEKFVEAHLEECKSTRQFRRPFKCKECPEEMQRFMFHRHLLERHKEKLKRCEVCGHWILKRAMFARHNAKKHGVARPDGLKSKVGRKKVNRDEPFHAICSQCGENFSDQVKYQKHLAKHYHQNESKKLAKCQICHKTVSLRDLSSHEMSHLDFEDGQPRTCEYCGDSFMKVTAYKMHLKQHKNQILKLKRGPYPKTQCPICNKWVTSQKRHSAIMHSQRERFPCDECGKTFAEIRYLERHKALHTEQFLFRCKFCNKGYNVKCALEYHEDTVHTKVKRYVCPIIECGESFFVNLYLRKHMKKVHPYFNKTEGH